MDSVGGLDVCPQLIKQQSSSKKRRQRSGVRHKSKGPTDPTLRNSGECMSFGTSFGAYVISIHAFVEGMERKEGGNSSEIQTDTMSKVI